VRVARTREKISLPVARNRAVFDLGGPLADGDGIDDADRPVRVLQSTFR
jgi:hypothetical protein